MSANRHIGLVSPLPPEATGIADYSASLLPALAQRWPTRAFTRQPNAPRRHLESAVEVLGYGELPPDRGSELLIYQLGNHHGFHGDIYRHALATPGIVVLHELALADLVRDSAHHDGGHKAFAEELRYALGATGNALARRIDIDGEGLSAHTWPLFERVVDRSFCTIVHGETAQDRVLASRPTAQVIVAPHHTVEEVADVEAAGGEFRRRHGLGAETLIVAAFGVVAPTKSIGLCLDAFEALTDDRDALFLLVGEGSDAWLGANRPAGSGRTSHRALGRVDASTLVGAMAATDIAFNLRRIERPFERIFWRLFGVPDAFGPTRNARLVLLRDRAAVSRCLSQAARWPIQRIVVAHGDAVEENAKSEFLRAFSSYLPEPGTA